MYYEDYEEEEESYYFSPYENYRLYQSTLLPTISEDMDGSERGSEEGAGGFVRTSSMEIISSGDEYCDAATTSPELEGEFVSISFKGNQY